MVSSKIKKLFTNKVFLFLFAFCIELVFNYIFEIQHMAGWYIYTDIALGPIFGLMFGPAGALGYAAATFTGEIIDGIAFPAPIIDFIITFFISVLTYKLWYTTFKKRKMDTPRFNSTYNIVKFLSITIIISILYFGFLVMSFSLFHNLNYSYHVTDVDFNIPYMLNIITFTIIIGLLLISSFNILKIPLQTPKKKITRININPYYLLTILLIAVGYLLFREFLINTKPIRHFLFAVTIITSLLLYFNTLDVKIKATNDNYSIIEEIILIFLIIISVTILLNFGYFETLILSIAPELDPSYQILLILSFTSVLILLVSLIHIRYIEKMITDPLYSLIDTADNYYFKTENNTEPLHKLKKYMNRRDSVGILVKSFTRLYDNIKSNLNQLQITTSEKEIFETEFDVASNIQSNMLPTNFDEFSENEPFEISASMIPAREVGGDFYNYLKIDDDNMYFVIGDVSGKGIPATLFMVRTMYLIENHLKFDENLSQVVENVNNLAYERNKEELFVTVWLGKLNLKSGRLSYVNAGHNPPLIKHGSNNFEYMDTRPNLVIGGMEGIKYREYEIDLDAGDMIFLYTDGITEANDDYNEFYGENRLKEIINKNKSEKLSDIIVEVNKDVDKFCNNNEQFDDTTMMIIKYDGQVGK